MSKCEREPLRSNEASEPRDILQEKEKLIELEAKADAIEKYVKENIEDKEEREDYLKMLYYWRKMARILKNDIDDI